MDSLWTTSANTLTSCFARSTKNHSARGKRNERKDNEPARVEIDRYTEDAYETYTGARICLLHGRTRHSSLRSLYLLGRVRIIREIPPTSASPPRMGGTGLIFWCPKAS